MNSPKLAHVGLTVDDLDVAVRWYRDVLGLELLGEPVEISSADPRIGDQVSDVFGREVRFRQAHLALAGGTALELFEFIEPKGERGETFDFWRAGLTHLCLFEKDIDGLVERIGASEGRVRSSRIWEVIPGERYRMCFCEDPAGNVVELYSHSHLEVFGDRAGYQPRVAGDAE